jgi:hypothetical protein
LTGNKSIISGYMFRRTGRRIGYRICRRLYRDSHPEIERCLLLAGTARSGTTWIGDLIAGQRPTRVMFEPFHPEKVAEYSSYNRFLYRRPDDNDLRLQAFCASVFSGQIRDLWIDRTVSVLRPQARIVKDVRCNLLLKWISQRFPGLPLILLLRHPCAVVHSRLELGWDTDGDIEPMLKQQDLVEDFLQDKLDLIRGAWHDEEKHAIIWAIHNAVPLAQFQDGGLQVIKYEDFIADTAGSLRPLLGAVGWDFDESSSAEFARPSRTSSLATALDGARVATKRWERSLSTAQVDRILRVVEAFGLSHLYS